MKDRVHTKDRAPQALGRSTKVGSEWGLLSRVHDRRGTPRRCSPCGCSLLLCVVFLLTSSSVAGQTLEPPANALPLDVAPATPFDPAAGSPENESDVVATPNGVQADRLLDPLTPEETRQLVDLVLYLIRENLPGSFVDDDEWGRQKKIYAGVDIKLDDWELKTKRRWKEVNHGRWRIFSAELVAPESPENLRFRASQLRWDGQRKLHLRLEIDARLRTLARQARWNYGVRLFSIHVDAEAWVRLALEGSVELDVDYGKVPPDLVLRPHVEAADLQLRQFEVDRVGHIGGEVAEALGSASKDLLRRKLIEPQRRRLPEKLNQQLERKQDLLRLSLSDWLTEWLQPATASDS